MRRSWKGIIAAIAFVSLTATVARAAEYGWAITFQGDLKNSGVPLNGTANFEFKLFTAAVGGVQLGPLTLTMNSVPVTNGVFSVDLDFTNGGTIAGVYDGGERWLDITVNGTPLAPRQRLAPAPHAAIAKLLALPFAQQTTSPKPFTLVSAATSGGQLEGMVVQTMFQDSGSVAIRGECLGAPAVFNTNAVGVLGRIHSTNGAGVLGETSSDIVAGSGVGVMGRTWTDIGTGVAGYAHLPTGASKGIYGYTASSAGWAGYFDGRGYFSDAVGIGTTNPTYSLHVNGFGPSILGESNDRIGTKFSLKNTDTGGQTWTMKSTGSFDSEGAGKFKIGTAANENRLCVTNSFVGVGRSTTISAADFAIESDAFGTNYGGMYINTPSATGKPFYGYATNGSAKSWTYFDGITASWRLHHAGSDRLAVTGLGDVGIGTTSPAFLLHVNGTAGKPGGGSWSVASDARLKKNIEPLDGALDRLLSLRGVTYEYIDPAKCNELPGRQTGMIAQDVEKVFPDWVETAGDGYKRLAFRGFEALTVEALRELAAQKDAQLAAQNEKIDALESQVAELRTMVQAIAMQSGMNGTARSAAEWTPAARVAN